MLQYLQHIDEKIFLYLNGLHSPFLDVVMAWISGNSSWLPLYLFLICWIIYRKMVKGIWVVFCTLLLFAFTDFTSVHLFKEVFERLRPSHNPDLEDLIHLVNGYRGGSFGFISSHAANTFGMATFISLVFKEKWLVILLLTWAAVVSYSRIYLGVHYPFDIVGGAVWGSGLAFGMYKIYHVVFYRRNHSTGT